MTKRTSKQQQQQMYQLSGTDRSILPPYRTTLPFPTLAPADPIRQKFAKFRQPKLFARFQPYIGQIMHR